MDSKQTLATSKCLTSVLKAVPLGVLGEFLVEKENGLVLTKDG